MNTATVTTHRAGVVWHGDRDDLRAHTVAAGGQIIGGSCSPLYPRVRFQGEVDAETVADLHARSHARCFIANSVSCPVEVATP